MSAADLIADLTRIGITVQADGDRLRYSPRSAVTADMVQRMKAHKPELLTILRRDAPVIDLTAPDGEERDERIAVAMEGCGFDPAMVIDPPDPCRCGSLELWLTVTGNWRCLRCDPPTTARRLLERKARINRLRNSTIDS